MSEFMKGSANIDKVVLDATTGQNASFENLRESLKAALVNEGRIERDRETLGYAVRALPGQQTSDVPLSAPPYAFEKEVRWAESTGRRPLLLRANSQAELDELERQITR